MKTEPITLIPVKGINRSRAANKPIAHEQWAEITRLAKKYNADKSQILFSLIAHGISEEKSLGMTLEIRND